MIRHTASAFVAAALVSAFAGNPAYAQQKVEGTMTHEMGHYLGLDHTLTNKNSGVEAKTKAPSPRGRACHKRERYYRIRSGITPCQRITRVEPGGGGLRLRGHSHLTGWRLP